ncbi:MAG: GTP pyrophosphokinase family protein, partial [Ruminococcus sp.]|nr:GTP pyrophosphokinase family protein [Ruminococcus sp.]
IRGKLERKNLPLTIESIENEIFDVAGIKVICSFVDDIYMLADCLLQQDDIKLIKKKDYIKNPKKNGYRSLHLIVEIPIFLQNEKRFMKVEVQLRTIAMEFWANLEHKLRYKKNLSDETAKMIAQELNDCAEMSEVLDNKMQKVRDVIENS